MNYSPLLTACLVAASVLSSRADITSDLVLHYKFDETAGNSALDSSGNGNPGYLENWPAPEWGAGRIDGALRFNVNDPAHDDYVVTDHPVTFNNQEQFSFSFWIKLEKPEHGSNPRFISPADGKAGWVLWMPGVGVGFEDSRQPTTQPEVGVWHHYVVTLNDVADAGVYNIYVDGVKQVTNKITNRGNPGTVDWIIGHSQNGSVHGDHWYGKLDDVRIYNRVLADADALELFQTAGPAPEAPTEILDQPLGAAKYTGDSYTFRASATGSGTLTYQWKKDGVDIPGAIEPTYRIPTLELLHSGSYTLVVTGPQGTATSREAVLTVTEKPPADITSALIAHWKFDETSGTRAEDSARENDVLLENFEGNPWVQGRVGSGAIRLNVNDPTHNDLLITENALPLDNEEQFSFAFWLKREGEIVPSNPRIVSPQGGPGWVLWMPGTGVNFEDNRQKTPEPLIGAWRHYVVTVDSGTFAVYVDGTNVVESATTGRTAPPGLRKWLLGHGADPNSPFDTWRGDMDDIRIYNRVLTSVDVAALYAAAGPEPEVSPSILLQPRSQTKFVGETVTFKATADGTKPLAYEWRFNGTAIPGGTSDTLILRNLKSSQAGSYTLFVSNAKGSATSQPAVLIVESIPAPDITSNLIAHWKFDETSGTDAADASGKANHLTLLKFADETSHWVPGKIGGAVSLNVNDAGHDDTIVTADVVELQNQEDFTFSFWLRREGATPPSQPRIISPASSGAGWVLWMPDTGIGFENARGSARTPHPPLGEWRHYTVSIDSGFYTVYVDGEKVSTADGVATAKTSTPPAGTARWIIGHGGDLNAPWDTWRGQIDDVRFYNRAFNAVDAAELYKATGAFEQVTVAATSPASSAIEVSTGTDITIDLLNGYKGAAILDPASIQLSINNQQVSPTITQSGETTRVSFNPPISFASGSVNSVKIVFSDKSTPVRITTHEFSFTTANVTEVSGGGNALQAALDAAAIGAELVVTDSLDYSPVRVLKRVIVRAGDGQNPRVTWIKGMNDNRAVLVADGGRGATWDGIDVVQNTPDDGAGGHFLFFVAQNADSPTLTIRNCDIYIDLPSGNVDAHVLVPGQKIHLINCRVYRNDENGGTYLIFVIDKGGDSIIEKSILGPTKGRAIVNVAQPGGATLTIKGSQFTGAAYGIWHVDRPANYDISDTRFGPERMFSIFTGDNRTAGSVFNITRSIFAPPRSGEGIIFAADGNGCKFNVSNSVFFGDEGQERLIRSHHGAQGTRSHEWNFTHCTFNELAPKNFRQFIHLGEDTITGGELSSFSFQNNIINWPGSADAMVLGARGASAVFRPMVSAGKNLFNVISSNSDDALRGVGIEVNAMAMLAEDGIHLLPGSPALDAALPGFAVLDIDGQSRPTGAGFDLGADEAAGGPAGTHVAVSRSGATLILTWNGGGTLEETDSLANPAWSTVQGAVSGYTISATGAQRFFRVKQ